MDKGEGGVQSASWVVNIDAAVPGRKRLVRGVFWAQILAAMTAALVSSYGTGQLLGWLADKLFEADLATSPITAGFSIILVALAAGIITFRYIGRLRTGNLTAARITLVLGCLWLSMGLLLILLSPDTADSACDRWWFGLYCGFYKGFGVSVYKITEAISLVPGTSSYYAIVLAILLNSSAFGEFLRRFSWTRFRLIRWPTLFIAGTLLLSIPIIVVDVLSNAHWSGVQIGVIASLPVLFLALRTACEVIQPSPATILPPGWEPRSVRTVPWFGGRRRVRIVVLICLSALCGILWYTLSITMPASLLNPLSASNGSTMSVGDLVGLRVIAHAFPLVFLLLAVELYTRARRNAAVSATALRERDARPLLLYLRSFIDDDLKVFTHGSPRHSWFERFLLRRRERFEVMLIWHLWRFGPVVCIGRPREHLPPLGAARDYLSDSEWRDGVESRIREAEAIVVVLGHSDGLAWELEAIERLGAKDKTLIVVPPLPDAAIKERWVAFDAIAGKRGWFEIPVSEPGNVLIATLQSNVPGLKVDLLGSSDAPSTWALFAGSIRDEWHYEIALETALRYLERHSRAGVAALAIPPDSRDLSAPHAGMLPATRAFAARLGWRWAEGPLLVFFVGYFMLALYMVDSPGSTERVTNLHRGMCISEIQAADFESLDEDDQYLLAGRVNVKLCHESHDYEVYNVSQLDFQGFPSESEVAATAENICGSVFGEYVGSAPESPALSYTWFAPTQDQWMIGFRKVICLVYDQSGSLDSRIGTSRN
jgi:hypothetical protein